MSTGASAAKLGALLLAACCAVGGARAAGVEDALRAGELVCDFAAGHRHSLIAGALGDTPPVERMLVFDALGRHAAQVVSTRAPGRRPVQVRATQTAVHLIERAGPSVLVTTLTHCEKSQWRAGGDTCVRYAASHAWHFDLDVLHHPDEVHARLPSGALQGSCEPWRLD
ncbi:MAG: hypothetical protein AB7O31_17345 [Burkholderiales bacterium]